MTTYTYTFLPLYGRLDGQNGHIVGYTQVDAADEPRLSPYRWYRGGRGGRYAMARVEGQMVLLHRLLLGLTQGDDTVVEHLDGDVLNNRRANLSAV